MIQSILFFALGVFCAGFVALMVAPAIWRRAVVLTQRRIEASLPMSANEIRAEKDRLRAEFAMSSRRLEMAVESFREKNAAHLVEIGRRREELKRLADERDVRQGRIETLEAKAAIADTEMSKRDEQAAGLADQLAGTQASLERHMLELERLGRAYDDATYTASTRQIELVARENEIDKLSADIMTMRNQRKDTERKGREVSAEAKAVRDELKHEKRKAQELETKVERLMASLSDREEALERRGKELERLREQLADSLSNETEMGAALMAAEEGRNRLATELAGLKDTAPADASATGSALEKVTTERDRLEVRLAELGRENKRLSEQAAMQAVSDTRAEEQRENALLREQISALAAEVVSLAAALDTDGSAIRKALDGQGPQVVTAPAGVVSLADRVRALQKATRSVGNAS